MRSRQIHNVPYLKDFRRALRKDLTAAEAVLWTLLKNSRLHGRKFRRQHSIENYIVDFYCPAESLVIEVDGGIHNNPGIANADFDRDQRLKELGFKILRIENESVFHHPESVLEMIAACFTTPLPLLKTGGE